jgi:hypothetical protein
MALSKILRRDELTGGWKKLHNEDVRKFYILFFFRYHYNDKINEDGMSIWHA